jgi:hypothetical protein
LYWFNALRDSGPRIAGDVTALISNPWRLRLFIAITKLLHLRKKSLSGHNEFDEGEHNCDSIHGKVMVKLPCVNKVRRHEDAWGSGGIAPRIL